MNINIHDHACSWICTFITMYVHFWPCPSLTIYNCACTCTSMYTFMYVHVHLHVFTCSCTYMNIIVHVCSCTCTWTNMCVHVHVPTWPYMYITIYIVDHVRTWSCTYSYVIIYTQSCFNVHSGCVTADLAYTQGHPQMLPCMLSKRLSSFSACSVSASAASVHAQ